MRIAVATICKNEPQEFITRWSESSKEADYRLILDTGSDNPNWVMPTQGEVIWKQKTFDPWRFDHARNYAMSIIPQDIDYVIWLDMDEVLQPGWRQALEGIPEGTTRPRYRYVWSWNEDGSEGLVYGGDKIHARHGYKWKHPVHEVLKCDGLEVQNWTNGLEIHHHPDHTKSRAQYLPLLELAVQEDPRDDRNLFYLAREYFFQGDYGLAQYYFNQHLKLSLWNPERAASYRYLAKMRPEVAEYQLYKAIAEVPNRREPWVELAMLYYKGEDWVECRAACSIALAVTEKPLDYLCEAFAWGWLPHDLMAISCHHLGLTDEAFFHGAEAVALNPTDQRLQRNLDFYK